jgi:dolichyl-diphosphooligosaccharide--protein glycosyltransferase
MLGYARVFQNGYVISPTNDPYSFRYWLDHVLATSDDLTDIGVFSGGIFENI